MIFFKKKTNENIVIIGNELSRASIVDAVVDDIEEIGSSGENSEEGWLIKQKNEEFILKEFYFSFLNSW